MAILTIPTRTDLANYRQTVELDGLVYGMAFEFNDRDGHWYFDLEDEAGVVLRHGIKVVTNFPLLRQDAQRARPPGDIMAIDPSDADLDAGLRDLGASILLTYIEEVST